MKRLFLHSLALGILFLVGFNIGSSGIEGRLGLHFFSLASAISCEVCALKFYRNKIEAETLDRIAYVQLRKSHKNTNPIIDI